MNNKCCKNCINFEIDDGDFWGSCARYYYEKREEEHFIVLIPDGADTEFDEDYPAIYLPIYFNCSKWRKNETP